MVVGLCLFFWQVNLRRTDWDTKDIDMAKTYLINDSGSGDKMGSDAGFFWLFCENYYFFIIVERERESRWIDYIQSILSSLVPQGSFFIHDGVHFLLW